MRRDASIALRTILWLTLGGWIGSWALFALVIARLVFRVVPSPELAGHLVGPILGVLHWYGVVAGVGLAAVAILLRRGRMLVAIPLVLALASLVSQLGITPRMKAIHDLAFGPAGNAEASARYGQLHGISMALFGGVLMGAIALVVLHVRSDSLQTDGSKQENSANLLG